MTLPELFLGENDYYSEIRPGSAKDALDNADYIVTDSNVAKIYAHLLKNKKVVVIPAGEKSKSFEQYKRLAMKLKEAQEITAFGGGVVGDLTGFVAATLKRGVLLTHIPSTLLAMVDSSIGGKNGINMGKRKNYLGTFYQSQYVHLDPTLLKTLPEKEFYNGVAEIIKYGAIKDPALLERMQTKIRMNDNDLEEIIGRCVKIKKYFVDIDERDENKRHALNFGHTLGHALELEYNLPHGQAISIGMAYESILLCVGEDKTNKIMKALKANKLPTKLPRNANIDRIIGLMKSDKKGPLRFASDEIFYRIDRSEESIREVLMQVVSKKNQEEEALPF